MVIIVSTTNSSSRRWSFFGRQMHPTWSSCWIPTFCSVRNKTSAVNLRSEESASCSVQLSPSLAEKGSLCWRAAIPSGVWAQPDWLQASSRTYLLLGEVFVSCYTHRVNFSPTFRHFWGLLCVLTLALTLPYDCFLRTRPAQVRWTVPLAAFNLHTAIRLALESNWITRVFELVDEINHPIPQH